MAERRMFSKTVTNAARFLMMPASARLFYYDLGMAADDDGIVEAFVVMRISGADMKTAMVPYLTMIFEQNAAAVGGKMPDDTFYYGA